MSIHPSKQALEQQPPVDVVLGVRHSVLLNDALRRQVGDGPAEAVPADVISPGQAVPPRQPEVRYLRWGGDRLDETLRQAAAATFTTISLKSSNQTMRAAQHSQV